MTATSVNPTDVLIRGTGTTATLPGTFGAMMAREFRVLRRKFKSTVVRTVMSPLLFVFVFTYVLPKTGTAPLGTGSGTVTFATVLVPGLLAGTLLMQGTLSVSMPLSVELSWERTIEDRVLAPVQVWVLGLQKITAGAVQALVSGALVFPILLLVHAAGQAPHIRVGNWPLLVLVIVGGAFFFSSLGLLLGTMMDPRQMQVGFAAFILPINMLGCMYYPWSALHSIRWLQYAVLVNPMVYVAEGLRAALTPEQHMPDWAFLLVIVGGTILVGYLAVRSLTRRVLD